MRVAVAFLIGLLGTSFAAPAAAETMEERAVRLLTSLRGEWSFELGETTGTRRIETVYPELAVEWSETFDGSRVEGRGFIGWDPKRKLFFSMTIHNQAGEYGVMIGRLSSSEDVIEFEPLSPDPVAPGFRSVFRLADHDRFAFTALVEENDQWKARWTAVFDRIR